MNETINSYISLLKCPKCGSDLSYKDGFVSCNNGHSFEVVGNVINFTGDLKTNYDQHWSNFESSPMKESRSKDFSVWCTQGVTQLDSETTFLDLGCGDGNHTQYFQDCNYIAVDISNSIYSLAAKYTSRRNMIFLKADAFSLPLKNSSVDFIFSFAGVNYFPSYGTQSLQNLLQELDKVLVSDGFAALWGAGATSKFSLLAFETFRRAYRNSPSLLKSMLLYIGCISTLFIRNSANIHPFNSPLKHVKEIVSTNLTPDYINYLFNEKWSDLSPSSWTLLKDYEISCGQLFQKKSATRR